MNLFLIMVTEPTPRAKHITKFAVMAKDQEKAIDLVKNYYGPTATGWHKDAEFKLILTVPENQAVQV